MRDPALLEYVGRNMFKARVFPVPPKGETRIEIQYSEVIPFDSHTCRYVYPLDTEKFSPKPLEEVTVSATIESRIPIKSVYSPTHKVDETRTGEREVTVGFEERDVKPDKDFVLYYTLSDEDFGLGLVTHRQTGEDGFFLLMLAPKTELQAREIAAKDVIFVFDKSGSMAEDQKIDQAKGALKFCLSNLNEDDRFNVIAFATGVDLLNPTLLPASAAKSEKVLAFVDDMKAVGGTNINGALTEALKMLEANQRPKMVVFLTDGLPTVGETDQEAIIKNVDKLNEVAANIGARIELAAYYLTPISRVADANAETRKARLFAFGVGHDVNTQLLDELSGDNGGVSTYVQPGEDIEVKVSSFYEKISYPVLSNIAVDFGDVYVHDYYPEALPDLFKGSQLKVFGRYRGEGHIALKLLGETGGKQESFAFDATFPKEETGNDFIPRLWATRRIGYLLNLIRLKGENKELKDEIVQLSTTYGIMTPYTSYLVTEDKEAPPTVAAMPGVRRGLDAAGGWGGGFGGYGAGAMPGSSGGYGAPGPMGPGGRPADMTLSYEGLGQASGGRAVEGAIVTGNLREAEFVPSSGEQKLVKHVGGQTFYYDAQRGIWLHSEWKEGLRTYQIQALSQAYFDLLAKRPEWGKFLALGDQVALVAGGAVVQIGPDGASTLTPPQLQEIAALGGK
jgi:Ca-activated chloride channel family protein